MNRENLASWLVQDLRWREPLRPNFNRAARILDVLEEMVSARDISPKSALDVAINLGRLLVVLDLTRASSKRTLEGIYLRASTLLAEASCDEEAVASVVQRFQELVENTLEGS